MARRSSARLRNRDSSTPKRVSLSHDALPRTPRTAPVKLSALQEESDEMPGAFPRSESPAARLSQTVASKRTTQIPVNFEGATPKRPATKPAEEEMHPAQHQQSTAKPLEEARWLGFANMGPYTEPAKHTSKVTTLQGTPTRIAKSSIDVSSPKFNFSFHREQSLELSPEAKKLMNEKREEAARIREQMIANGEGPDDVSSALGRRIATPKAKKGRFSDVHMEQFKKLDSIADHPSAFRATQINFNTNSQKAKHEDPTSTKSLKRSPSKAQLDEADQHQQLQQALIRSPSKSALPQLASHLPRSTSSKNLPPQTDTHSPSPTKRVKRSEADEVSIARLPSSGSGSGKVQPATPQPKKVADNQPMYPDLSTITTPTQASLARVASVKSTKSSKIPALPLMQSPSKPTREQATQDSPGHVTPLLARSPSKAALFADTNAASGGEPHHSASPLLKRSPTKESTFQKSGEADGQEYAKPREAPLLSRTPLKMSIVKIADAEAANDKPSSSLLSRSPFKMSIAKSSDSEAAKDKPSSSTPLLSRSPARVTMAHAQTDDQSGQTSTKIPGKSLMGRFNLLRSSPMKSILRSPQRLYSDDPAKIAAGTHVATPPKYVKNKSVALSNATVMTGSVEKRVDFTSSTKARYERAQSELSSTPTKGPTPPPAAKVQAESSSKPADVQYPPLSSERVSPAVTPQKRRQTIAPGDFTFRAGKHSVVFTRSPNAPSSAGNGKRPSTIRHVSAEPQLPRAPVTAPATTAKKRKFDFENDKAAEAETAGVISDKENGGEEDPERPAKRMKPTAASPAPVKPAAKRTTLGVKPKKGDGDAKDKKSNTISKARLNALAQPKRRT
ncbi:hypothetical protein LTR37_008744 [Vermiconidia calcicola]|uniref:Uncharacterized protein n=1 Tax=Vermiconidia calcicola TaxID=1690605 RepID=A0ACC3NAJ2_9PEZI|nr:hypothetical protein LTR37_008744 [Vermiconidia calcicola]